MTKILIVDDETPSRKQIENELVNLQYSEKYIKQAANGISAINIAAEFKPDILITDISMPKMLGTDLACEITKLLPKCKIIFFSGYSDKKYLKAAIKLNVVDYLEKPLDSEEFAAALKKAEEEIKVLNQSSYLDDEADAEFLDCIFKKRVSGSDIGSDKYKQILKKRCYACATIVPCSEYTTPIKAMLAKAALQYSVSFISRYKSDGTLEIMFFSDSLSLKYDVERVFKAFLSHVEGNEYYKCAVGSFEKSSRDIYISYENAACALDNAFFFKPNTLVFYTESEKSVSINDTEITQSLYSSLAEEKYGESKKIINFLYQKLYGSSFIMSSGAKKIYYNMFEAIYSFFKNYSFAYNNEYNLYDETFSIHKAKFLDDLNNHILQTLNKAEKLLCNTDFNSIVKAALYYMEKNYSNPNLSIVDIAQHCNVNANYLCGTFKSVTGETINHYINNMRIENSKKLMLETNKSIADISKLCGFNDAKYFCKVFGKYAKSTPTSFRKKYK